MRSRLSASPETSSARRGGSCPPSIPAPTAFGAGGPGRLGDLGRELYLQWQRGLDARAREAQAHAARMHDLADLVSRSAGGFADANESVRSQHRDEGDTGATAGVM